MTELYKTVENTLFFDDINLEKDIAKKYGTPTFVFSARKIKENINQFKENFVKKYENTIIAYSMKNNFIPEICSLIADEINLFEISSLLELKIIEKIILKKRKDLAVISTNIYKPNGFIQEVLEFQKSKDIIGTQKIPESYFAIDSYEDFNNIENVAKKTEIKPKVMVRVNPGIKMDRKKTIFAAAEISAKCGLVINDTNSIINASNKIIDHDWFNTRIQQPKQDNAEFILSKAYESKYLDLVGVHFHLGSQITEMPYFDHFFKIASIFYKLMNEKFQGKLELLDFGGGYPIKYGGEKEIPSLKDISESLITNLKNANIQPTIILESGRYITANAGVLLTKVNLTKEISTGKKIAVLDLSVYSELLDVLTANWHYDFSLVNALPSNNLKIANWSLVGETNDILDKISSQSNQQNSIDKSYSNVFPRNLVKDDLIAIKNTGAYTTCFNSHYGGRPYPIKLLIKSDVKRTIKEL